jgi:hypothetical protein
MRPRLNVVFPIRILPPKRFRWDVIIQTRFGCAEIATVQLCPLNLRRASHALLSVAAFPSKWALTRVLAMSQRQLVMSG